jgi:tetratricopeptide (TPR) repeat protein
LLVNNTIGSAPAWFNEGLAEYFSTFSISGDQRVNVGRPISSHVHLLRRSRMLPLRTLLQVDHKSPYYNERDKQSIFYAQSWALMHYLLLNSEQRASQLARFIDLISTKVPAEQAFSQSFNTSFEVMESELREYIRQDHYRMMQRTFERKLDPAKEMQSRSISEAEATAYLGDLLLHSERAETEAYLLKALSLDPNLAMAHASLGMLRFRQGRPEEARVSLERAVAANSQNYLIHYYYAYVLGRPPKDDGRPNYGYPPEVAALIRSELKKAIALRPDYPESYNLLAFINLVTNTDLDESILMLKRALESSPGRIDFMYMLGQIYMNKDNYRAARPLLEQVVQSQEEERVRRHASKLIETMAAIEEDRAKRRSTRSGMVTTSGTRLDSSNSEFEELTPIDPADVLREALRQPADGETQLQGSLLRVDCGPTGFIFVIKSGDRVWHLKTDSFRKLGLITYDPEVKGEITCGARSRANVVVVCYVPFGDKKGGVDGSLKSLAFVPSDFQLKPAQ